MKTKEKKVPLTMKDIDWADIEAKLNSKQCKVVAIAKEQGWNQLEFKNMLLEKYGTRIVFRKGCRGGVFWSQENKS